MTVSDRPDITVSIVSYNTRALLRECLRSLAARQDAGEATLEVVVADNGSTDGSVDMVRGEFPWVRLVETGGNVGYGRANNAALAEAQGRYFFVLNSDTEVEPGALSAMRDFLDLRPEIGMLGATRPARRHHAGLVRDRSQPSGCLLGTDLPRQTPAVKPHYGRLCHDALGLQDGPGGAAGLRGVFLCPSRGVGADRRLRSRLLYVL